MSEQVDALYAEAQRDRDSWNAWAAKVGAAIESGDQQRATREVLIMARFVCSAQVSNYGAERTKDMINVYWVAYLEKA